MKFTLTKASDCKYEKEKEINNLEELLKIVDKEQIILSKIENGYEIKIYDWYIE